MRTNRNSKTDLTLNRITIVGIKPFSSTKTKLAQEILMNSLKLKVSSEPSTENQPDFSVAKLIRFLKHLKLRKLLQKIKDSRDPQKTKYQLEVVICWALSVFFFRRESVNSFYAALEKLSAYQRKNIWYFLGCEEGSPLPHRTVITDCLALLDPDEINGLLIAYSTASAGRFYKHPRPDSMNIRG